MNSVIGPSKATPRLVAVGSGPTLHGEDAAVWTSRDGITWSRVSNDKPGFGGQGCMNSVTEGLGGSAVVVGIVARVDRESDGAVWIVREG